MEPAILASAHPLRHLQRDRFQPEKAKEYVTCGYDRDRTSVAGELWLVDVQQLEVGQGRAFQIREDISEADPSQLVYPIRGKQVTYICSQVQNRASGKNRSTMGNAGCYRVVLPHLLRGLEMQHAQGSEDSVNRART